MEPNKNQNIGYVVSVQGPVVDVKFTTVEGVPAILENVNTQTVDGRRVVLEVAEHLPGNIARCIAINSTFNLQRNSPAYPKGEPIQIPPGDALYGRIINVWGEPIDNKGEISTTERIPIRRQKMGIQLSSTAEKAATSEILETGIKVIDLLFPLVKGSKNGILGGAALGKSILTLEIIHNIVKRHQG